MEIREEGFVFEFAPPVEEVSEVEHRFKKKQEEVAEDDEKTGEPIMDGPVTFIPSSSYVYAVSNAQPSNGKREELLEALTKPILAASKKGIGKTHLIIETKSLSSIEIVIDHYDTDPYSFYIRLMGNREAQGFFEKNRLLLSTQLRSALPAFHCTFAPFSFRPRSFLSEKERKNSLVKSSHLSYRENKDVRDLYD